MNEKIILICVVVSTITLIIKSRIISNLFCNLRYRFSKDKSIEKRNDQIKAVLESIERINRKSIYENFNEMKLEDDESNDEVITEKEKIRNFKKLCETIDELINSTNNY